MSNRNPGIGEKAGKGKTANPVGLRDKVNFQTSRALFPFRKSTLIRFQKIIANLRDNLGLALTSLQMLVKLNYSWFLMISILRKHLLADACFCT